MNTTQPQKSVLITGSSGSIGQALCQKYLASGYFVYGLDLKAGAIQDRHFKFLKGDLAKPEKLKAVLLPIKKLDVLIHNAADTAHTFKPLSRTTLKDWQRGLTINLTSPFWLTQLLVKHLRKSRGSIILMSSTRHLMSEPDTAVYSASKGGIFGLTHSLAVTLGPEVRVNCISPGWIAPV
ncbi:MAG: SDR family NAD(P)-dependent oxidoreductase, partial [Proteobacteria bacterium]